MNDGSLHSMFQTVDTSLSIHVPVDDHRPVCGFIVLWFQVAFELFALFHHNGL